MIKPTTVNQSQFSGISQIGSAVIFAALIGFITITSAGCPRQSPKLLIPVAKSSPSNTSSAQGTGDSGGGNSYLGKPLDSYVVQIADRPAFRKYLQPIMDQAFQYDPVVYWIFSRLLTEKPWYLVPGPLSTIPAERIGSVVPTNQAALQTLDAVWINQNLINSMDEQSQSDLILHEMLMGMRLLRFDSLRKQCQMVNYDDACQSLSMERKGSLSDLTSQDYNEIRETVAKLKLNNLVMFEIWEDTLASEGFSFPARIFRSWSNTNTIDLADVRSWLMKQYLGDSAPQFGFDLSKSTSGRPLHDTSITSDGTCSFEFSGGSGNQSYSWLNLSINTSNGPLYASADFEKLQPRELNVENAIGLSFITLKPTSTFLKIYGVGAVRFVPTLIFQGSSLRRVQFDEMDCEAAQNNICTSWISANHGIHYACGVESVLRL